MPWIYIFLRNSDCGFRAEVALSLKLLLVDFESDTHGNFGNLKDFGFLIF